MQDILSAAAVFTGIGSLAVSGILWNIIKAYKERIAQLEDETKACQDHHIENQTRIHELEGQLATIKDIPLLEISKNQKDMLKTQKEILNILREVKT